MIDASSGDFTIGGHHEDELCSNGGRCGAGRGPRCVRGSDRGAEGSRRGGQAVEWQELTQLITSNGLTGLSRTRKSNWVEYYDPSGTIVGSWKVTQDSDSGKYGGTWKIEGDKFCGDYESDDDSDGCYGIAVNGDRVYFLDEKGMAHNPDRPAAIIQGKPEGI
jgi:hypothetical protein